MKTLYIILSMLLLGYAQQSCKAQEVRVVEKYRLIYDKSTNTVLDSIETDYTRTNRPGAICVTYTANPNIILVASDTLDVLIARGIKGAATTATALPVLPVTGQWVEYGKLYQYGAAIVFCRQSHSRTIYAPELTPALFAFYRSETDNLEWIAGEQVVVGNVRTYKTVKYKCLRAHQTQVGWEPLATLGTLWGTVTTTNVWAVGVAYKIGDVVTYGGRDYRCRQSHTSLLGWEPPNVLALWLPL